MHTTVATLRRSNALVPIALALCVILVLVYWISQSIAKEEYRNLLISVVLIQAMWIFVRWRTSIYLFMVYICVEGFLVNYFWTRPELNFLKDVLVVSVFGVLALSLVHRGIFPFPAPRWVLPFLAFALVYSVQVLNPRLPNLLVGLVGIRVTLLYALLVPVGYWFFTRKSEVMHFFLFLAILSIPLSLFGLFQYVMGPEWMISLSPGFERAVFFAYGLRPTEATGYFRTFSTFVQTGSFSQFLMFIMLLFVALGAMPLLRRWRLPVALGFLLHFLALLSTGGRTPLVMFGLAFALLVVLQRKIVRLAPFLVLAPLVFWASIYYVGPAFIERYATILDMDTVTRRNIPLVYGWLKLAMQTDWTGEGAGCASIASRHVGETRWNSSPVENGLAKIRLEAGLPGFLFFVLFLLILLLDCIRSTLNVEDADLRWLASVCAVFIFVNVLTIAAGTPFDVSPSNVLIWFFLGFLGRAPWLSTSSAAPAQPEK